MTKSIITVQNLTKEFTFTVKSTEGGWWRNWVKPERKTITAVNNVSFTVKEGEILAFIGPNGAGKSTTIKMLSGILHPTAGSIEVDGLSPQSNRQELAFKIGAVFGQRSQLLFNLPMEDSFELFGKMYELSSRRIKERTQELVELFDLGEFFHQPVRKLSLGQRMRAEIALSLIHSPKIIFLDEPTIGLDIVTKRRLREVLVELNRTQDTTIFLTSHDVGDIEAISKRTIVINHGKIVVDTPTEELRKKFLTEKFISLEFKRRESSFALPEAEVFSFDGISARLKIDTSRHPLNEVVRNIVNRFELEDMDVHDAPLEDIISEIYQKKHEEGE